MPLTLRELCWMAEGARRDAWDHTSAVLCMTANVNRDPKKPARKPADFHPFHRSTASAVDADNKTSFSQMKKLFVRK